MPSEDRLEIARRAIEEQRRLVRELEARTRAWAGRECELEAQIRELEERVQELQEQIRELKGEHETIGELNKARWTLEAQEALLAAQEAGPLGGPPDRRETPATAPSAPDLVPAPLPRRSLMDRPWTVAERADLVLCLVAQGMGRLTQVHEALKPLLPEQMQKFYFFKQPTAPGPHRSWFEPAGPGRGDRWELTPEGQKEYARMLRDPARNDPELQELVSFAQQQLSRHKGQERKM